LSDLFSCVNPPLSLKIYGLRIRLSHVSHLVFAGESGFLLTQNAAKTWARRGQTPVHRHRYRRDKISVISGISVSPKQHRLGLYYQPYFQNIGQEEMCVFLRHLLRRLRGPVIAILGNSQVHQGEPLRQHRTQHPRLHIEHFPSHAPELNPDEGVWSLAKRELANGQMDVSRSVPRTLLPSSRYRRRTSGAILRTRSFTRVATLGPDQSSAF